VVEAEWRGTRGGRGCRYGSSSRELWLLLVVLVVRVEQLVSDVASRERVLVGEVADCCRVWLRSRVQSAARRRRLLVVLPVLAGSVREVGRQVEAVRVVLCIA